VYALALGLVLVRSYFATKDFRRQLARHAKKNPELAWRYDHLWFICKQPHLCPRCKGWLGGVGAVVAWWVLTAVFGGYTPGELSRILGPAYAALLGAICLVATPLHGMAGRLATVSKDSFWESEYVLAGVGFVSALAAPLLISLFFYFRAT
jgi:hypothetical protein